MVEHVPGFILEVLCFDDFTFEFLAKLCVKGVKPFRLADFESRHPDLVAVKSTRKRGEYFFTCTSCWTLDVAERNIEAGAVTYIDADMKFYSSPDKVYELWQDRDVMVCEHLQGCVDSKFGRFNVGWISFRLTEIGIGCLRKWKNDCIEWCFDRVEDGKFADQKYLDGWPEALGERLFIAPRTLDLGPWGIKAGEFNVQNRMPCLNYEPIILYHFQGLRILSEKRYYIGFYFKFSIRNILKHLYEPYIRELLLVEKEFGIVSANGRYAKQGRLYNMLTSYRIGRPVLSDVKRWFQSAVNAIRGNLV